jgi:hypothetical protein
MAGQEEEMDSNPYSMTGFVRVVAKASSMD